MKAITRCLLVLGNFYFLLSTNILYAENSVNERATRKMNKEMQSYVYLQIHTVAELKKDVILELYDNDTKVDITTGDYCGKILVYVNGNPIQVFTIGATVNAIDYLIDPGKNKIEFKGKSELPIFVKVVKFEKPPQHPGQTRTFPIQVLTKTWLDMEKDYTKVEFEVEPPIAQTVDDEYVFDTIEDTDEARKKIKEEIQSRIRQELAAIRAKDLDLYYSIQSDGEVTSVEQLIGSGGEAVERMIARTFPPGLVWPEDSYVEKNLIFLFGNKTILVYDGEAPEWHYRQMERRAYLLIGKDPKTNHTSILSDTLFYKKNGRLKSTSIL